MIDSKLSPEELDFVHNNTAAYIEEIQGEILEDYMVDICNLIDQGKRRIAISACHAVGKTHGMAAIVDALMSSNKEIKVVTTAPTFRQVELLLWNEIKSRYNSKPDDFKIGNLKQVRWDIDPETFAVGFSPNKEAGVGTGQSKQSPFQGFHAKYWTVVVFDEATGVNPQIWVEAEGLVNTGKSLFLCIGNPTARNTHFYKCFQSPAWTKVKITCFDTANFKANGITCLDDMLKERDYLLELLEDEGQEIYDARLDSYAVVKPHLISLRWSMEKLIEWGEEHPLFMGKVLGEFPNQDDNVMMPESVIRAAIAREYIPKDNDQIYIGVDVARFGADSTVFTSLIGWGQVGLESHSKKDSIEVLRALISFIRNTEGYGKRKVRLGIDSGYGQGVIDTLNHWLAGTLEDAEISPATLWDKRNITVLEIAFGSTDWVRYHYGWKDEKALRDDSLKEDRKVQEDRESYQNFKAKMFDVLARDLRGKLALLDKQVYIETLPTIIIVPASDSKMKIESKQDYKDRTGMGSPDEVDSLALANLARYFAAKPLGMLEVFETMSNN